MLQQRGLMSRGVRDLREETSEGPLFVDSLWEGVSESDLYMQRMGALGAPPGQDTHAMPAVNGLLSPHTWKRLHEQPAKVATLYSSLMNDLRNNVQDRVLFESD